MNIVLNRFLVALVFAGFGCHNPRPPIPIVHTVLGPIHADSMGLTLIHEHVFLDWDPIDSQHPEQWNRDSAFAVILPFLKEAKSRGVKTFLECTPNYLGRDPMLLIRLAEASGLQILTNTGYYGAREDKHIPKSAFMESPDEIAQHWVDEFEQGIEGTPIRPGFIKIGVDADAILSEIDAKIVRAAALAHLRTGLTIVGHTGPDGLARQQLDILSAEGVAPEAIVWTHAQGGTPDSHIEIARRGAWVSLDGLGWVHPKDHQGDSTELKRYINFMINLKNNDLLHRTLISHDAGWFTHGEQGGGTYKPYTVIFELIMPELRKHGFGDADFHQLLVLNPSAAYRVRTRRK
jgi:phosphotriesterase-related protein